MDYCEILQNAVKNLSNQCKACPVCDGRACVGVIPGPGSKMSGQGFIRSFDKLHQIKVNLNTIYEDAPVNTKTKLFGKTFRYPFFAAPIAAISTHYGDYLNDESYAPMIVGGCKNSGIAAFVGDGIDDDTMTPYLNAIFENGGIGIPTIKPWSLDKIMRKIELCKKSRAIAYAVDIDACGFSHLTGEDRVEAKTESQLKEIIKKSDVPMIVKGIMTVSAAEKAANCGAYAVVISNHGGRVLDDTPAPVEVLCDIRKAVGNRVKIFIDGAIRTGLDVFKVLALGADAALIGRPYPVMAYGGGRDAIELYTDRVGQELLEVMKMTGALSIDDIKATSIYSTGF